MNENQIAVKAVVNAPIEKVWEYYTSPEHITKWAFADDSWEAPHAENDVRVGGRFVTRMQEKGGTDGFDFSGTYDEVKEHEYLAYTMDGEDKRTVSVRFSPVDNGVEVTTVFDMEHENPREMQEQGWQAILNNFKEHVESA